MPTIPTVRNALLFLGCAAASATAEVAVVPPADLSAPRRDLFGKSPAFLKEHPAIPHVEGGADFTGMDCSGTIIRRLKLMDIEPPGNAQGQYEWLKKSGRLTVVPAVNLTAAATEERKSTDSESWAILFQGPDPPPASSASVFTFPAPATLPCSRPILLPPNPESNTTMLHYALVFIIVAIIAAVLGFGSLSGLAATIAQICFVLFLILALVSFLRKKA